MKAVRLGLLSFLGLILLLGDQLSKALIYAAFERGEVPVKITEFFNLVIAWNKGVSFSFLASDNASMPYVLAGFSALVSIALLVWLIRETSLVTQTGIVFIISGAIGNALDRYTDKAVLDFLQFHYADWYFPAFNVADICINIGVGLVLIEVLFLSGHKTKQAK